MKVQVNSPTAPTKVITPIKDTVTITLSVYEAAALRVLVGNQGTDEIKKIISGSSTIADNAFVGCYDVPVEFKENLKHCIGTGMVKTEYPASYSDLNTDATYLRNLCTDFYRHLNKALTEVGKSL